MAVSNFLDMQCSGWNLESLRTIFWDEDIDYILKIPVGCPGS